ncbi:hypothetical protein CRUP_032180 [Coryphaenoides rupestris]|nr:hypothetical protein CRUP_032180 [Coryphaenoides rupestris]
MSTSQVRLGGATRAGNNVREEELGGVGFSFIFAWVLMAVVSALFVVGGNVEKLICEPLANRQLFKVSGKVDLSDARVGEGDECVAAVLLQQADVLQLDVDALKHVGQASSEQQTLTTVLLRKELMLNMVSSCRAWGVVVTVEKSALTPSWASLARTVVQVWATAPLVQAGSDSVLDREARSPDRLACSRPVPSCRVSRDVPMLSSASLVSRMAGESTGGKRRRRREGVDEEEEDE